MKSIHKTYTCLFAVILFMGWLYYVPVLHGVPAKPTPTKVYQPDGTAIRIKGFGDEFYNFTESIDGYSILRNDEGWWVYAKLGVDGQFEPSAVAVNPVESRGEKEDQFLGTLGKHLRESNEVRDRRMRQWSSVETEDHFSSQTTTAAYRHDFRYTLNLQGIPTGTVRPLLLLIEFSDIPHQYSAQSFQ